MSLLPCNRAAIRAFLLLVLVAPAACFRVWGQVEADATPAELELWIDSDYVVHRTAVVDPARKALTWNFVRNGVVALQRVADEELQYPLGRVPGVHAVYLTAFRDGAYRVVSNVIHFRVRGESEGLAPGFDVPDETEAPEATPPPVRVWIDSERVVQRPGIPDELSMGLCWVVEAEGTIVLRRNARGETQHRHWVEDPGSYAIWLEAGAPGSRKRISNVVRYRIPGPASERPSPTAAAETAAAATILERTRSSEGSILLLLLDPGEGGLLGDLLRETGFTVTVADAARLFDEVPVPEADLVLIPPASEERSVPWSRSGEPLFGRLRGRRVLAMGESGAEILGQGDLLVGNPNGWHGRRLPKEVALPRNLENGPFRRLLLEPSPIAVRRDAAGDAWVTIERGPGERDHVGIYDHGAFPHGTIGIGRERSDGHHWLVARQGNFTLWGADTPVESMTPEGVALLLNLCDALIQLPHEDLRWREYAVLSAGTAERVLRGGHRDHLEFVPHRPGRHTIRLEWEGPGTMTLLASDPAQRRDGRSPLAFKWTAAEAGDPIRFKVGSFDLPEGAQRAYTVTIRWEEE